MLGDTLGINSKYADLNDTGIRTLFTAHLVDPPTPPWPRRLADGLADKNFLKRT